VELVWEEHKSESYPKDERRAFNEIADDKLTLPISDTKWVLNYGSDAAFKLDPKIDVLDPKRDT
jgi:hypothetical protein